MAGIIARRDQLEPMETQEKNRLAKTLSSAGKADIRDSLGAPARRIAPIKARIEAFGAAHPQIAHALHLPETIPGIGRVTAVTLLAWMPNSARLGQAGRRAIASLGGLAPRVGAPNGAGAG